MSSSLADKADVAARAPGAPALGGAQQDGGGGNESGLRADTPRRPAAEGWRADVQGLRALAVIAVVIFHTGLWLPGGFVGVDVFFVISGFVITSMLAREHARTGRIDLARFYVRRVKRLTPALAVVLTATVLVGALLVSLASLEPMAWTALGGMALSANLIIEATSGGYFDAPAESNPLLNMWSLSVEEQFYLIFPALLMLGWWAAGRRGAARLRLTPLRLVLGIGAISLAAALVGSHVLAGEGGFWLGFYSPLTRTWEFAVGAALALAGARLSARGRTGAVVGFAGLALVGWSLFFIHAGMPFPGVITLIPVAGTALLIAAGADRDGFVGRVFSTTPMTWIGDRSYSWYLWHWPAIVLAVALLPGRPWAAGAAAALSLIPAAASFRWVEEPLRRVSGLTRAGWARLGAAFVVAPVAAALAVGTGLWPRVDADVRDAVLAEHAGRAAGCHADLRPDQRDLSACTWNAGAAGAPIYLVGDSQADHFSEAAIGAAEALDRPVTIATASVAPVLDTTSLRQVSDPSWSERVKAYSRGAQAWLDRSEPGTVLVATTTKYWVNDDFQVRAADGWTSDRDAKLEVFRAKLTELVADLEAAGHDVVLVRTIPHWSGPDFSDAPHERPAVAELIGAVEEVDRAAVEAVQGPAGEVVDDVASRLGADVLDLRAEFCDLEACYLERDGEQVYRDRTHISVAFSEALAPEFAEAVAGAR